MLKKLCDASGVSGNEGNIRDIIIDAVKPHCDSISIDKLGNVIAFKKAHNKKRSARKIMAAAHMDEVGFMVKSINKDGFLSILPAGGIDRRVVLSKRVKVGKAELPGIISYKPPHAQRDGYKKIPKWKEIFVDIGAKDKKDAEKHVSVGDYISFDTEFVKKRNLLRGKAFDDRFGCYGLIEILKKKLSNDLYAVFTVQEEVGLRGASAAGSAIQPDYCIVLEGTSAGDFPQERDIGDSPKMGEGVVLTISDRTAFSDKELRKQTENIARRLKIKYQYKQPMIGGTDAGVIHLQGSGARCIVMAVASRYIHSPVSFADYRDLKGMMKLAYNLINEIK